jgi:hypothetical protein
MPRRTHTATLRFAVVLVVATAILLTLSAGGFAHTSRAPAAADHGAAAGEGSADHGHDHSHDDEGAAGGSAHFHHLADHSHLVPGAITEFRLAQPVTRRGWQTLPPDSAGPGDPICHDRPPKPALGA